MNGIPRVVFDTNILFSAVGWLGNPHQCVQAARQGKCLSLTCEPILAELAEKLQLKRGFDVTKATEIPSANDCAATCATKASATCKTACGSRPIR